MDCSAGSVPSGAKLYGCPTYARLSATRLTIGSGLFSACRMTGDHSRSHKLDVRRVERGRHHAIREHGPGRIERGANRRKAKHRPVVRRSNDDRAAELRGRAANRLVRKGFVPSSDAARSSVSIPCVAGVSCCVPPSKYRFAAMTSFAVLRRRMTFNPLISNVAVAVSPCARDGDGVPREHRERRDRQRDPRHHGRIPESSSEDGVSFSASRIDGERSTPVTCGLPMMYLLAYDWRSFGVCFAMVST